MFRVPFFLLSILLLLLVSAPAFSQKTEPIAFGETLPDFPVAAPASLEQQKYLGVQGATFRPSQIEAEVVVIELLNVYCPDCWMKLPEFSELYYRLQEDPRTRDSVKMLGIAVGNTAEEVADFVERLQVPYPVVPDPTFVAADAVGAEITPFTLYVRQGVEHQPGIVVDVHHGLLTQHQSMLEQLKTLAHQSYEQLQREGERAAKARQEVASLLNREELEYRVRNVLLETGGRIEEFSSVPLRSGRRVYTATMTRNGENSRVFAEVVSGSPSGEAAQPVHYIYAFDETGTITALAPLRADRGDWTKEQMTWLHSQVVGQRLGTSWSVAQKPGSVVQTKTASALVNGGLNNGGELLQELRAKNLIGSR